MSPPRKISPRKKHRPRSRKRLLTLPLLILLPILGLALILAAADFWIVRSTRDRANIPLEDLPAREFALVLGTSPTVADGRSNLFFSHRIDAAAEIYEAGKARVLILSGATGPDGYDEPAAIRDALLSRGIPAKALLLDRAGHRTFDSVVRAKNVFGADEILIISQEFHNQRALFIADRHEIDAIAYAAPDVSRLGGAKVNLRESLARVKAILDLYLLHPSPSMEK